MPYNDWHEQLTEWRTHCLIREAQRKAAKAERLAFKIAIVFLGMVAGALIGAGGIAPW